VDNKGLLFIPDISGFTRFVNQTEIEHSRWIVQELLEILINSNEIGLQISEIEGDAILFYKFGQSPSLQEMYKQVEKMFREFHKQLIVYDNRRFCQCQACSAAANLSLKVITHYGEFTGYHVKNFNKLIGKDVIVAHQLLKNDIEQDEYWLVTKEVLPGNPPPEPRIEWNNSSKQTENGEVIFRYTPLTDLKKDISPDVLPQLQISNKTKLFSLTREYGTDYITLFHAVGDFNFRHQWLVGVKSVEEVSHFLPRIGTKCRAVLETGDLILFANSYSYQPGRIDFSETDERKKNSIYYLLEALPDNRSRLTLGYYQEKNFFNQFFHKQGEKKKLEENFNRSLDNLGELVKKMHVDPGILKS
jgi:uncharacterized protein DUF2652